jgi:hypothetical protein
MNNNNYTDIEQQIADAIDTAEEICSPLDDIIERSIGDPGAPFDPEVIRALARLRGTDFRAYETVRAKLKSVGCRVTELDKATTKGGADACGRGPTQADILIGLAQSAELFQAPDGRGYVDIAVNGHRETWLIRSKELKNWLTRLYYERTGGAPNSEALQSTLNVLEAKAQFDAPERMVHVRVARLDNCLYLDLCDESWRAIEIDAAGWRTVENPPVRFKRAPGMKRLPAPLTGGSIETLRGFLNVRSNTDFTLAVAWLLAAFRDRGPYPVLCISGEHGSAKSTFSAILRALIDPNTAPLRALPREERDLFIAANNGLLLAFDNVSDLKPWISDSLCRLATGGGSAGRQLYTDQDEVLFNASRPVILNGIEDIVSRPDLADRALFLTLDPIPEDRRQSEAELWSAFEIERPRILGALLDGVSEGLRRLPETHLPALPRMADFALWASACETAFWKPGTFWLAYCHNRDEAVADVIEADPIASSVVAFMAAQTVWTGTATDLLGALERVAGERETKSQNWPKSPEALGGRLRRAATNLRKIGVEVEFVKKGRSRTRTIHITSQIGAEKRGARPSAQSALSAFLAESASVASDHGMRDGWQAVDDAATEDEPNETVRTTRSKLNGASHTAVAAGYRGEGSVEAFVTPGRVL